MMSKSNKQKRKQIHIYVSSTPKQTKFLHKRTLGFKSVTIQVSYQNMI